MNLKLRARIGQDKRVLLNDELALHGPLAQLLPRPATYVELCKTRPEPIHRGSPTLLKKAESLRNFLFQVTCFKARKPELHV